MIKLVAFDLVGVLAYENDYELNEVEGKIERLFGANPSDEDFTKQALAYAKTKEEVQDRVHHIINNIYGVRDENIVSKIKEINSSIKVIIATNHVTAIKEWIVKQPFYDSLDGLFISAELNCCKPALSFYDKVSQAMKIDPNEILFVDDSPKNIEGAKEYGMKTLLYNKKGDLFECVKEAIMRN